MADVRSLLKKEQSSRRINHPQASYSDSGKLLCTLCRIPIKTESLWSNHIKSAEHITRLEGMRKAATVQAGRKRKADDDEDEGRKRARAEESEGDEEGPALNPVSEETDNTTHAIQMNAPGDPTSTSGSTPSKANVADIAPVAPIEEDPEWAALLREIDDTNTPVLPATVNYAQATISAAPVSAEEIAAQAREEQSTQQRGRRDAEIEGEKEDAAIALQDEFEEMEELEQRVRKLREKREALRLGPRAQEVESAASILAAPVVTPAKSATPETNGGGVEDDQDDEDDNEDDEEDFDDWKFGRH